MSQTSIKSNNKQSPIAQLMTFVENLLANVYNFDILTESHSHLVSEQAAKEYISTADNRAAVLFDQQPDELFIGIYINNEIRNKISFQPPLKKLNTSNLDALCTITEEISHFHLLLQRIYNGLETSKTELEFQAELDKLVVASHLLYLQVNDPHIFELVRYIFDIGIKKISESTEYLIANEWAHRVWQQSWQELKSLNNAQKTLGIKNIARGFYYRSLAGKYTHLTSREFLRGVA